MRDWEKKENLRLRINCTPVEFLCLYVEKAEVTCKNLKGRVPKRKDRKQLGKAAGCPPLIDTKNQCFLVEFYLWKYRENEGLEFPASAERVKKSYLRIEQ